MRGKILIPQKQEALSKLADVGTAWRIQRREKRFYQRAFQYDRTRLLETAGKTTQRTLENYDKDPEASRTAEPCKRRWPDGSDGRVVADAIAAFGLLILPHRKQVARKQLREKIARLRTQLISGLTAIREKVKGSVRGAEDALAPYTRFIKAENERVSDSRNKLTQLQSELRRQSSAL